MIRSKCLCFLMTKTEIFVITCLALCFSYAIERKVRRHIHLQKNCDVIPGHSCQQQKVAGLPLVRSKVKLKFPDFWQGMGPKERIPISEK